MPHRILVRATSACKILQINFTRIIVVKFHNMYKLSQKIMYLSNFPRIDLSPESYYLALPLEKNMNKIQYKAATSFLANNHVFRRLVEWNRTLTHNETLFLRIFQQYLVTSCDSSLIVSVSLSFLVITFDSLQISLLLNASYAILSSRSLDKISVEVNIFTNSCLTTLQ